MFVTLNTVRGDWATHSSRILGFARIGYIEEYRLKYYRSIGFVLALSLLSACGGSDSGGDENSPGNPIEGPEIDNEAGSSANNDDTGTDSDENTDSSEDDGVGAPDDSSSSVGVGNSGSSEPRTLLMTNTPAPGLAGGTIVSVSTIDMSSNGWVAAGAGFRDSDGSASAIWRGIGGDLSPVIKSTDSINGLAANSWFQQANEVLILEDSSLWALVELGGVKSSEEAIIKIDADGNANLIFETGSALVDGGRDLARFRDLQQDGENILVWATTGGVLPVYLMAVSQSSDPKLVLSRDPFDPDNPDNHPQLGNCRVVVSTTNPVKVNDNGGAVAEAALFSDGTGSACSDRVIVAYSDENFSVVYTKDDPLPINDGSTVFDYTLLDVTADGDAVVEFVHQSAADQSDVADSLWKIERSGNMQLIALSGEEIPGADSSSTIARGFERLNLDFASGNRLLLQTDDAVLKGAARSDVAYSGFFNPGASQLNRVVGNAETVPGLGDTSSFSAIENAFLDEQNSVWFVATASDSGGVSRENSGLWYYGDNGNRTLAIPFNNTISTDEFHVGDSGQVLVEFGTVSRQVIYNKISR